MRKTRIREQRAAAAKSVEDMTGQPWDFLRAALSLAQTDAPFGDFLGNVCLKLSDYQGFDSSEIWTEAHGREFGCRSTRDPVGQGTSTLTFISEESSPPARDVRQLYERVKQSGAVAKPFRGRSGAAWISTAGLSAIPQDLRGYGLLILLAFPDQDQSSGLVVLRNHQFRDPDPGELSRLELVAESVAVALRVARTRTALAERIKELTCLYRMALLAETPCADLEDHLKGVAELLPDAWLYPQDAWARIELEGVCYGPSGQADAGGSLRADIVVLGVRRGTVEVAYRVPKPTLDQGPFLREERSLLDTVAREIALLVERKQREAESRTLEEQLRHADRLATIGELAAGVAHELNEPLANILGFAQLAGKGVRLPKQTREDINKIVQAALHARGLTQQLLLFARRMPQNRARIDLNAVVLEALRLLEPLCERERVTVVPDLSASPVPVHADNGQLRQVIVNLVVNGVQAMPDGGRLSVQTAADCADGTAVLTIEDTGTGMSDDVASKIFLPFFTTKEAGRGTGLGLAVVHGIVTSHGGRIEVHTEQNQGSRFDVFLPLRMDE